MKPKGSHFISPGKAFSEWQPHMGTQELHLTFPSGTLSLYQSQHHLLFCTANEPRIRASFLSFLYPHTQHAPHQQVLPPKPPLNLSTLLQISTITTFISHLAFCSIFPNWSSLASHKAVRDSFKITPDPSFSYLKLMQCPPYCCIWYEIRRSSGSCQLLWTLPSHTIPHVYSALATLSSLRSPDKASSSPPLCACTCSSLCLEHSAPDLSTSGTFVSHGSQLSQHLLSVSCPCCLPGSQNNVGNTVSTP